MLRSELLASIDRLIRVVEEAQVADAIAHDDVLRHLLAYHALAQTYANASRADLHLLKVFDLTELLDPEWWARAFDRESRDARRERAEERGGSLTSRPEVHSNLVFAIQKLPLIVKVLEPDLNKSDALAQIELLLPEHEDQVSSPARVIAAIESIVLIYSAVCKMHNEKENTLTLRSCDSGSDKSFDFTGLPQIIEQVKSVIFGIVDRVIFFREMKFGERVKRVAESLPILDQIAQMEEAKRLPPEQAELLRRDLINGATKFLETGSVIPEVKNPSRYDARQLLQPSPKLLLEGPSKESRENRSSKESETQKRKRRRPSHSGPLEASFPHGGIKEFIDANDGLSDDERRLLIELLSKRRKDK